MPVEQSNIINLQFPSNKNQQEQALLLNVGKKQNDATRFSESAEMVTAIDDNYDFLGRIPIL